jgi:glucokinase
MSRRSIICGDVGGTHARLQLWSETEKRTPLLLLLDRRYASRDFDSLTALVARFVSDTVPCLDAATPIDATVIAICGPVENERRSAGPVLPEQGPTGWGADAAQLEIDLPRCRRCRLINDFVAVGYGIPALEEEDVMELHSAAGADGEAEGGRGLIAAVGAGTGLGAVFLTWHNGDGESFYCAHPSEGGMSAFTARTDEEWQLREWLRQRDGGAEPTVESVVSGPGLSAAFEFVRRSCTSAAPFSEPAAIAAHALATPPDKTARRALDLWLGALGGHLRATALHLLPRGGLYITGGIAPQLAAHLRTVLPDLYVQKHSVMGAFVATFPLRLVLNADVGLLGARIRAERLLREAPGL